MVKTTIVETTEKYDDEGKLVERLIREEKTEDGTNYIPSWTSPTQCPWGGGKRWLETRRTMLLCNE